MDKKLFVIIATIVIAIAGGFAYLSLRDSTDNTTSSTAPQPPAEKPLPAEQQVGTSSNQKAGAYVDYSAEKLATTKGTRILFFHAPWCPQCRALESSIKSGFIPDGVTILKVDYDSNQALRQKYGVTIQTTLIKIDANGNLVKKYVAYDTPTLTSVKENLLP